MLDGEGAYTAVEGEKTTDCRRGDFIDHAPTGRRMTTATPPRQPMMWLDVLDMPTVNHFEDLVLRALRRQDAEDQSRRRRLVRPLRHRRSARTACRPPPNRTPVINYTYAKMRPILERLKNTGDVDKRHGAACATPTRSMAGR